LPGLAYFENGVLVTGSPGFLGSHICRALEKSCPSSFAAVDVRDAAALRALAERWRPEVILHLASTGIVLASLSSVPEILDVAADGLIHLLEVFAPKLVILPSSSSVYGNTAGAAASPSTPLNPLSIYGLSKVISERILRQWTEVAGGTAIVLRIGNLIGRGGRGGLLSFLVNHALRHPFGAPPAQMRGAGRMVRDYVPVDYAAKIFQAAIREEWEPGQAHIFNVGSGRPRTNEQVACAVQRTLKEYGLVLNVHFQERPGVGEASAVGLDTSATEERLGIKPLSESDVVQAIREAVLFYLEQAKTARAVSASS
jgi:UDP-glucose 4-epimerase